MPYIEAAYGYWIDSDDKIHAIDNRYEFDDGYLKKSILFFENRIQKDI